MAASAECRRCAQRNEAARVLGKVGLTDPAVTRVVASSCRLPP